MGKAHRPGGGSECLKSNEVKTLIRVSQTVPAMGDGSEFARRRVHPGVERKARVALNTMRTGSVQGAEPPTDLGV